MVKFRTITQAYNELKKIDPDTAISLHYLRGILSDGTVPTIKAGTKTLVDMNVLEEYLLNISSNHSL